MRDVNNKYFIKKIFVRENVFKSSGVDDVHYKEYYAHVYEDIITVGVFAQKRLDLYLNILEKAYNWNDLNIDAQQFILSEEAMPLKEIYNHFQNVERDEAKRELDKLETNKLKRKESEKLKGKNIKFKAEETLKKELDAKTQSKKKNKEKNSNSEIVKYWQKLLIKNNNPYIGGDFKNLKGYQNFITSLSPLQKD